MRCSNSLAALTAAMLLVHSGCGGGDKKESGATGPDGTSQAKAIESTVLGGKPAIDISYVLPDHFAAIIINPRRIAAAPLVAEQLKDEKIAEKVKEFGLEPSEVEQVAYLLSMGEAFPGGRTEPIPTMVVHFNREVDARQVLGKLQHYGPAKEIEETQVAGRKCFDLKSGIGFFGYSPNPTTVIVAQKGLLEKLFGGGDPKSMLAERLRKADADNDVIVVLSPGNVSNLDKLIAQMQLGPYADVVKGIQGGEMALNLKGESLAKLGLDAKDAAAADAVEKVLKDGLKMAGAGLAFGKLSMPPEMKQGFAPAFKLGDEALDGTQVTKSGNQVSAVMKRPADLDQVVGPLLEQVKKLARESAARAAKLNRLHQIGFAFMNYYSTFQKFPLAAIEKDGKPLLSWRVTILPFIDQNNLYKQFHLDEPWDSAHNLEVAKKMPEIYQVTGRPNDGMTSIMVFSGKGTAFDGSKAIGMADIRDGMSHTILAVEAGPDKAVPWTKPEDLPFDPESPLAALGRISPNGFLALFFDASVHELKVDNHTLKALITPAGGEPFDPGQVDGGR